MKHVNKEVKFLNPDIPLAVLKAGVNSRELAKTIGDNFADISGERIQYHNT